MLLSRHQNVGQNRDIKIANRSFGKCVIVQLFGDDSNKPKFDSGGIKRRLNSGNACYHSVQALLSSRQLSKNLKVRICNIQYIILPVVLYGCET
jgi:hypothetical protein